jgi:hypothetical protein
MKRRFWNMTHGQDFNSNAFQIWAHNQLPIFVRRLGWSKFSLFCVVDVEPKATHSGLYGRAWGYFVHTETGIFGNLESLNCAGCYEWRVIPFSKQMLGRLG